MPPPILTRDADRIQRDVLESINLRGRWHECPARLSSAHLDGKEVRSLTFITARGEPEWSTFAFDCGHNVARLKPEALTRYCWLRFDPAVKPLAARPHG